MWWDDDTIEQTVTKQFVCGRLPPQDIDRLDQPLSFGDNLTDCTYWEWIDGKAKKIFLVLNDMGLAGHIFELIDDSLDDEDLPIALHQVERLALTTPKDEKTERRFYRRQFHYLLRHLEKGSHIDYDEEEVIPLEVADKKHAASPGHHIDRVTLPDRPDTKLCRCRIPLGPGHHSWGEFIAEINGIKHIQNEHLMSYWASYTYQGYGYILFTPAPEFSAKSLLTTMPSSLKNLHKKVRRRTVMNWIYCLVKTVCFLHDQNLSHGNIKPSTVRFSGDNHVFFSGFTRFQTDVLRGVTDNTSFDKEAYDYAGPEKLFKPLSPSSNPIHRSADHGNGAAAMAQASTPNLSQQAADVFSLGCVILELLSFLFKKQGKPFASHRAAKHKSAGRGGAVPDSSFHKNLGQVETWMAQLAKEASKKDDPVFKGVAPMLYVAKDMLAFYPLERPTINEVQARINQILAESCGISEPHCVQRDSGCDFGLGRLALGSSPMEGAGNVGGMSIRTNRGSGFKDGQDKRNSNSGESVGIGSGGSSVRSSIRSVDSSATEAEGSRAIPTSRNDFPGSEKALQHILMRDKAKTKWQPSLYEGSYGLPLF